MAYDKKPGGGSGKSYGSRDGIDASAPQGDQVSAGNIPGVDGSFKDGKTRRPAAAKAGAGPGPVDPERG